MPADELKCVGCLKTIDDGQYLRCSGCQERYDLLCANVSKEQYVNKMTTLDRNAWQCVLCISKKPKTGNINTPVRSAEDNVNRRRGGAVLTPQEQLDKSALEASGAGNLGVTVDEKLLDSWDIQSLIVEFRQFREEMKATRMQMEVLNTTMSKLATRVDACDSRIDQLAARLDILECRANDGPVVAERADGSLMETVLQLKAELNERDQELLCNDIEISCIPELKSEGLPHIVMTLANKLGVTLAEQDIVSVVRVGRLPEPQDNAQSPQPRPRPIVVRLARRSVRDQLMQAARVRRGATTEGTGLSGPPRRFYVNERLTRENRLLFRRAREIGARLNWRFVWTRDGRVYARQHHGVDAPRHRLRSEADLARVFGPSAVRATEIKN